MFDLVRSEYAEERLNAKLEYILRVFNNVQAYNNLKLRIIQTECELCRNPFVNKARFDTDGDEYRYAYVNVGEGYYVMYIIEDNTIIVTDYFHKREFRN